MPDPFALALALTVAGFAAAGAGALVQGAPADLHTLTDAWVHGAPLRAGGTKVGGLWSLLGFGMQMVLVLVTGFVLAGTRPAKALVSALTRMPQSGRQATALVGCVAMGLALLHWGIGLIVGALLARGLGEAMPARGVAVHRPSLAAAGYLGLVVWHGGLSGSAPLKVSTHAGLVDVVGVALADQVGAIGLNQTVLSPRNLIVTAAVAAVLLWVVVRSHPVTGAVSAAPGGLVPEALDVNKRSTRSQDAAWSGSMAQQLSHGPWLSVLVGALAVSWAVGWVSSGGWRHASPNELNLVCLGAGLLLAGSPVAYAAAAREAMASAAGIVLQFPLYGGLMGLLAFAGVGARAAAWLPVSGMGDPTGVAAAATVLTSGALNLLVPSGGGQWAVQGPVLLAAAAEHNLPAERLVLALAWGDGWTNLLQPFWALPLLGITGVRAQDLFAITVRAVLPVGAVLLLGAVL